MSGRAWMFVVVVFGWCCVSAFPVAAGEEPTFFGLGGEDLGLDGGASHRGALIEAREVDLPRRAPLIIGHRGTPTVHPGNTLEACRLAIAKGAAAVEIDLCLTRDDRIVLWHDEKHSSLVSVIRAAGLEPGMAYRPWLPNLGSKYRRPVHELSLATFRRHYGYTEAVAKKKGLAKIGAILSPLLGTAKRADYEIPSLEDFGRWAFSEPRLQKFFLDVKVPEEPASMRKRFAERAYQVLAGKGLLYRTVFMTTSPAVLKTLQERFRHTGADFILDQEMVSLKPDADDFGAVGPAKAHGCRWAAIGRPRIGIKGWDTYKEVLSRDVRAKGAIKLVAWTINDEDDMKTLVDLGVDAIMTDHPDRLARVIANRPSRRTRVFQVSVR